MTAPPSIPPRDRVRPDAPAPTGGGLFGDGPSWSAVRAGRGVRTPPAGASSPGRRGPAVALALSASAAVVALYVGFVRTTSGRLVDDAAWHGAATGQNRLWQLAGPVLDVISGPFIVGVLLATMLLAVLRRRVLLAVQVAVVMGGANLTTQVLKHALLQRPDLGLGDRLSNTLPSGHTTAAASVAVALVLVVPRRLRPTAALLGAAYTAATGISTLVGRWHRPSDVVAAVLVVLAWAGAAHAIGRRAAVVPPGGRSRASNVVAGTLLLGALGTSAVAALALQRSLASLDDPAGDGLTSRAELLTAYGGGALGVAAVACLAFALLLLMLRSAEARAV